MSSDPLQPVLPLAAKPRSFRRAVFRGLALILPPILTIVVFLWMFGTVQVYVLKPVTDITREALVWLVWDVHEQPAGAEAKPTVEFNGRSFVRLDSGQYIPATVVDYVRADIPGKPLPNAQAAYEDFVNQRYLRPVIVVPVFVLVFVLVLYVLGKMFAAGLGGFIESIARRLPLVRSVYASVKKVTDMVFVESEVEFKRVVAIEFPRPGIWTVGLVTGEGMSDIAGAAHEPCVTVAVPGSPVPFTGNVVTVRKSDAHDLNLTVDEALQFFISCGVVVPARELREKGTGRDSRCRERPPWRSGAPVDAAAIVTPGTARRPFPTVGIKDSEQPDHMTPALPIRIGTRASPLARWQAQWVADQLAARGHAVELVPITTRGDVEQQGPIGAIGVTGVFTKELQRALLDGRIDVAVHSLKDLPTDEVAGLTLAAVPPRESPYDALVSRDRQPLSALRPGATVGTGSLRRQAQLLHIRPDLQIVPIRGNVETRLGKVSSGEFDALVLAEAGLKRLGLADQITEILGPPQFLPAIGQGALGLETRDADAIRPLVAALDDPSSHAAVVAERSFLAALQGGCLAPIGAWGRISPTNSLELDGVVVSPDGRQRLFGQVSGAAGDVAGDAAALGRRLAAQLLDRGAATLVGKVRGG